MTTLHTILLGIIEGITEFLPVSSTAHLDITRSLLHIPATSFVKSFEIVIQLGAILAVVLLYRRKIFSSWMYFKKLFVAFIPTGIIGFILYKIIKSFLLGNPTIASIMLVFGGIMILFFEKKYKQKENDESKTFESLSNKELLIMGLAQSFAVVPGVSRSLMVICSGTIMGLSRKLVTEFSFLLAIPTMLAATLYDLYKSGFSFSTNDWQMLSLGFIVSFGVALVVIKWLLEYIRNHSFSVFGWYRIIIGILTLILLFAF